jgi:hypothetical protein
VKSNLKTLLLPLFIKNIVLLISLLQRGAVITHPAMWMPPPEDFALLLPILTAVPMDSVFSPDRNLPSAIFIVAVP